MNYVIMYLYNSIRLTTIITYYRNQCKVYRVVFDDKREGGNMGIAENLKRLREQRELTQYKLAQESGVSHVTILNIEGGKTPNPRRATVGKIAGALGVPPGELQPDYGQVDDVPSSKGLRAPSQEGARIVNLIQSYMALSAESQRMAEEYVSYLRWQEERRRK